MTTGLRGSMAMRDGLAAKLLPVAALIDGRWAVVRQLLRRSSCRRPMAGAV